MAGNFKLAVGLAAGYVLGTRAGRERYERLVEAARNVADRPEVQQLTGKLRDSLGTGLDRAASSAESAGQARSADERGPRAGRGGDSGSEDQPARSIDRSTPTAERSRTSDEAPPDADDEEGERRRERSRTARAARR